MADFVSSIIVNIFQCSIWNLLQLRYLIKMLEVLTIDLTKSYMCSYMGIITVKWLYSRSVQGHSRAKLISVCPDSNLDINDVLVWGCLSTLTPLQNVKLLVAPVLVPQKAYSNGKLGRSCITVCNVVDKIGFVRKSRSRCEIFWNITFVWSEVPGIVVWKVKTPGQVNNFATKSYLNTTLAL